MDYLGLRTDVQSAMARSDIPTYVYRLANAQINSEMRLLEMLATTTLTDTTLPSDFMEVESLYYDRGGVRQALMASTEQAGAQVHEGTGTPKFFAVHGDTITLMPQPDRAEDLILRYYARLADFAADTDTNTVLTRYPGLYFYSALTHAAIWAKDDESAATYAQVFQGEVQRTRKADVNRRIGVTLKPRIIR